MQSQFFYINKIRLLFATELALSKVNRETAESFIHPLFCSNILLGNLRALNIRTVDSKSSQIKELSSPYQYLLWTLEIQIYAIQVSVEDLAAHTVNSS